MSDDAQGEAPKKLTTAEILAKARAKSAGAAPAAASPAAPSTPAAAPETPASPAPAASPAAGKPKSTADILAAARAAKSGGVPSAPPAAAAAPKPAAGGPPKSTADILAAARAKKGEAAPAASAPASSAPAAQAPVAAARAPATAGAAAGKSVQEMLAAMRPAKPAESAVAVEAPVATAAPPMPVKPVVAKKASPKEDPEIAARRNFLVVAWAALTAVVTVSVLGTLRFMLPNVLAEPPRKFKIGSIGDYDLGTVATKWVAQYGIWVVHTDQYRGKNLIYALVSVCTHLGCTPSWLEGEQKFKCPCHGSGFYITGVNFEGPAPRPLERAGIRLAEDGMLEVDKSFKFQEEMGQWQDAASFVEVS